uniref:Uncharacterized protein n=1 Tax=Anguilla anguilla TaxID=7936 RepID=A0A0E9XZ48_ANGAN
MAYESSMNLNELYLYHFIFPL